MEYNVTTEIKTPRYIILDLPAGFIYYKPVANVSEHYTIDEIIPDGVDGFSNNLSYALNRSDVSNIITLENYNEFYQKEECDCNFWFAG